jgi:hypothetical protein
MIDEEKSGWHVDKAVLRMAFDTALAVVVGLVGFFVAGINAELQSIKAKDQQHSEAIANMRERLPIDYVRMDLYMRDRQELRQILDRIDQNVREHRESLGEWQKRNNGHTK